MKPTPEEFEITGVGVTHKPTGHSFVAFPHRPTGGTWQEGHSKTANEYDSEEVKKMMRHLFAKKLVK